MWLAWPHQPNDLLTCSKIKRSLKNSASVYSPYACFLSFYFFFSKLKNQSRKVISVTAKLFCKYFLIFFILLDAKIFRTMKLNVKWQGIIHAQFRQNVPNIPNIFCIINPHCPK